MPEPAPKPATAAVTLPPQALRPIRVPWAGGEDDMDDTARFDRLVAALHDICREFREAGEAGRADDEPAADEEADAAS